MRALSIAALALLAACAATPDQVRQENEALVAFSKAAPEATARCLQRKWEAGSGEVSGHILQAGDGTYELQIRQLSFGVISVYEVTPRDAGSAVRWWPRELFVASRDPRAFAALVAGCT